MFNSRYYAIVKEWESAYGCGLKSRAYNYDLTEARLCCRKCGKLKVKMSRHHTGNDFFFAQMLPKYFAKDYIQFRKQDTEKLCAKCHKDAHRLYKPLMVELWIELNEGGQQIITKDWCEKWMLKFRARFYVWVNKPVPRKRKRRRKPGLTIKREV